MQARGGYNDNEEVWLYKWKNKKHPRGNDMIYLLLIN